MGFLETEEIQLESKNNSNSKRKSRIEIDLLAIGKRTGLSFAEMNELRVKDLLYYANSYLGTEDDGVREATQEDIDRFYA